MTIHVSIGTSDRLMYLAARLKSAKGNPSEAAIEEVICRALDVMEHLRIVNDRANG